MSKRRGSLAIGVIVLALMPSAHAQDGPQALRTASLAATCAACHAAHGDEPPGALLPSLAGRPAAQLREQMLAFRHGTRPGTVMPQLAKGFDAAQIDRLADYFAGQAR